MSACEAKATSLWRNGWYRSSESWFRGTVTMEPEFYGGKLRYKGFACGISVCGWNNNDGSLILYERFRD